MHFCGLQCLMSQIKWDYPYVLENNDSKDISQKLTKSFWTFDLKKIKTTKIYQSPIQKRAKSAKYIYFLIIALQPVAAGKLKMFMVWKHSTLSDTVYWYFVFLATIWLKLVWDTGVTIEIYLKSPLCNSPALF